MREYSRANADRINAQRRARWHTTRYGLTDEERDELFARHDGLCAICYERPAEVIDHDHVTGVVRGALCSFCNKGLGFIEEMNMLAALHYLKSAA